MVFPYYRLKRTTIKNLNPSTNIKKKILIYFEFERFNQRPKALDYTLSSSSLITLVFKIIVSIIKFFLFNFAIFGLYIGEYLILEFIWL